MSTAKTEQASFAKVTVPNERKGFFNLLTFLLGALHGVKPMFRMLSDSLLI